jgi:hypothetical protein
LRKTSKISSSNRDEKSKAKNYCQVIRVLLQFLHQAIFLVDKEVVRRSLDQPESLNFTFALQSLE